MPSSKIKDTVSYITIVTGALLLVVGVFKNMVILEKNQCEMTYMLEYPEYIRIPLDDITEREFPKYSLMLYGEGQHAEDLRSSGPSGIPVLFIPGNAGSHKQVRSLGSVSLKKTERLGFNFDFFTVGFNEEFTALRGSYLRSQTKFVHVCMDIILRMYNASNRDVKSLVLIGHSMGGVIARGLVTLGNFDRSSVNTIITLASPNTRPPLMVDEVMSEYYQRLSSFWGSANRSANTGHLILASLGGGERDVQVPSNLIPLLNTFLANQTVSVIASSVPKVWLSADHRCIVWCKQLILAIVRALIDMVHTDGTRLMHDAGQRMEILRYHFVSSFSSENSFHRAKSRLLSNKPVNVSSCKRVTFSDKLHFRSSSKLGVDCVVLRAPGKISEISVMYKGDLTDWIGTCESETTCEFYSSLAGKAEIIPSKTGHAKVILMKGDEVPIAFVIRLGGPRTDKFFVKVAQKTGNAMEVGDPHIDGENFLRLIDQRVFLRLALPFMQVPWFAYRMLITSSCKRSKPSISLKFVTPWLHEDVHDVFEKDIQVGLLFNSDTTQASSIEHQNSTSGKTSGDYPELHLWFDSKCNFTVRTSLDYLGTTRQLFKFSYHRILPWTGAFSVLHLTYEAATLQTGGRYLAAFLCMIAAHFDSLGKFSTFNGLAPAAFETIIAYSIFSILVNLSRATIHFLHCLRNLMHSLMPNRIRSLGPHESSNQHSSTVVLFIAQLSLPVVFSFLTSGGVGVIVYVISLFVRTMISPAKTDAKALHLSCVQILLLFPGIVTRFKETLDGHKTAYDVSTLTCSLFTIAINLISSCENRTMHGEKVLHSIAICTIAVLIVSPTMELLRTSQLLSVAVALHCFFTKKFLLKKHAKIH